MRHSFHFLVQEVSKQDFPPISLLIAVGLGLIALTGGALLVLSRTLPSLKALPSRVFTMALAYNALIIGVKFVFAPLGFYQTNRETDFESLLGFGGLVFAGAGSAFLMYFLVLGVIYWVQKRSVRASMGDDAKKRKFRLGKGAIIGIIAGVIVLGGSGLFIIAYLAAFDALQYLSFIFLSAFAGLVLLMLVGATVLGSMTFKTAGEQAAAVGNAALLSSLFWVAVCLLAAYHVLWVVFILMLNSVWPLRVVVPK